MTQGLIGQTLADRWVIESEIARGGFGAVFVASDRESGDAVAVKILHQELAGRAVLLRRFEREAELVQRIAHPNVVDVVAMGRAHGDRPYFVMEHVGGASLKQHLLRRAMAPGEALAILEPVCSALEAAHAQGIVHRDIKASNIMVDDDGRVVLLDFGVAKLLDNSLAALTGSRDTLGTPPCMAPEQILGKPIDARTDVYALGVLLFQMLTGGLPFRHRDIAVLFDMHARQAPPRPSSRVPVGPAVDSVVLRAMAKEPGDRFASAAELVKVFRAAVEVDGGTRRRTSARSLAVHAQVSLSEEAYSCSDPELFDLLDAALPTVRSALEIAGMKLAVETGDSALLVAALPVDPSAERQLRVELIAAIRAAHRRWEQRFGSDSRVMLALTITAASDNELMRVSSWLPHEHRSGLYVHDHALEGLGQEAEIDTLPGIQIAA